MSIDMNDTDVSTASTAAVSDAIVAYEIDALLVIRWLLYIMVAYRVLEIFVTSRRLSTRQRLNSRYLGAVFDLINGLTKEEGELLLLTMNNTVLNAKISSEGLKQRNKKAGAVKRVQISEHRIYYPPAKYDETEIEQKPTIPVLKTGDRMPNVEGQLVEETIQPQIIEMAEAIGSLGVQQAEKPVSQVQKREEMPVEEAQPTETATANSEGTA